MPVRPGGNVSGMNPSIAKDQNKATRRPGQPLQLAYKDNNDREMRRPGIMAHSTKVPETTLMDASVTHKQSVCQGMTDIKDLKTNDFRDSSMKTPKITVACPPFAQMGNNLAGQFEDLRENGDEEDSRGHES